MTLADTSVWVNYLRGVDLSLGLLLEANQILMHPMIIGELACGNLRNRSNLLNLLNGLPRAPVADDREVLFFIEQYRLMGRGIGFIDVHLLAATSLAPGSRLWTDDRRLRVAAVELNLA